MGKKRIANKHFEHQMWRYGFFSEQFPPCFTSETFASRLHDLRPTIGPAHATAPATLSTYKTGTSRRILSVPNPYAFAHTVDYIRRYREDLFEHASSPNSESPITFIHPYNENAEYAINSSLARAALGARSDFITNLRKRIVFAMGYRFRLSIDIATFYDSVYTHSIAWAICGKEEAKRIFAKIEGCPATEPYKIADDLDKSMRNQKNRETSGILTGPFTSRIFSEIILAAIDKELRQNGFIFKRYVDDFKFYFHLEADAQKAIINISKILAKYSLAVNQSKVRIEEYPFDIESPIKKAFNEALKTSGVFGALNEASRLHLAGEKGVYKYVLKMLRKEEISEDDREVVLAVLFNINLLNPGCARYTIEYLAQSKSAIGEERLAEIINSELERCLEEEAEQESLNLLYFSRTLHLPVREKLLKRCIKLNNDFVSIIALDYFAKQPNLIVPDSTDETPKGETLEDVVTQLEEELKGLSMDSEHWFLLYESKAHGLLNVDISIGKTAPFFKKMMELGVSFYSPEPARHPLQDKTKSGAAKTI